MIGKFQCEPRVIIDDTNPLFEISECDEDNAVEARVIRQDTKIVVALHDDSFNHVCDIEFECENNGFVVLNPFDADDSLKITPDIIFFLDAPDNNPHIKSVVIHKEEDDVRVDMRTGDVVLYKNGERRILMSLQVNIIKPTFINTANLNIQETV